MCWFIAAPSVRFLMDDYLLRAVHVPKTRKAYRKGREAFAAFLSSRRHPPLQSLPASRVDRLFCDFIHASHQFSFGRGAAGAKTAFYGLLEVRPDLKSRLPFSRQALKGWDKLIPSVKALPLPLAVKNSVA